MIRTMRLLGMLVVFAGVLSLSACGGGGGGGAAPATAPATTSTYTSTTTTNIYAGDEGTPQSPVSVPVGTPRPSTVGLGDSYYAFIAPTTGTYSITLANPTVDVSWDLYPDSSYSDANAIDWCDTTWTATTESCTANLTAGTTYYLKVSDWYMTSGTFALDIELINNEGSATSPINLVVGTPHAGSVAMAGTSYYRFTTNSASAYSVALSNTTSSSTTVKIFATPFDTSPLQTCSGWNAPVCTANGLSASTPYYVEVIGNSVAGITYTINVTPGISQGSIANPVGLVVDSASPYSGAVDGSGSSYYTFTTGDSGEYLLNLDSAYVSADVYSGADFSIGHLASCTGIGCRLTGLNAYTPYYIRVWNYSTSNQPYQISVNRGTTEGSLATPVALTLGSPRSATIDSNGTAYYSFTTSSFAGSYTISLAGTQSDLMWDLYTTPGSSNSISQCDNSSSAVDESCPSMNLEPNTTYYLSVINNSSTTPSPYTLNVTAGGGSQGTLNNPVDLGTVPSVGLTYASGQVRYTGPGYFFSDYGMSYYKFTTGPSDAVYVISLQGQQTDLGWNLNNSNNLSSSFLDCDANADTTPETCSTQPTLLKGNTTYYLHVYNNSNLTSTFSLTLTPLDVAAGCTGTYSECIDFESGIPSGFSQSTNSNGSKWQWTLDSTLSAGPGTNSLHSGTLSYPYKSCFSYTPAVRPKSVTFSTLTTDAGLDFSVYEGTTAVAGDSAGSFGTWIRETYPMPAGTSPLTLQWCMQVITTTSNPVISVDDIELQ